MAVSVNVTRRSMSILVDEGVDANGKAVTKAYAFSNVKPDAGPEKIEAAGRALGGLFAKDMAGITLSEKSRTDCRITACETVRNGGITDQKSSGKAGRRSVTASPRRGNADLEKRRKRT